MNPVNGMKALFDCMRRHIKNTLIPHHGNNFRPHLVSAAGIFVLLVFVSLAFSFSLFRGFVANRGADFTAAVLPAVLVNLANTDRANENLPELVVNPLLEEAARMKAEHMAANGYFAHNSPDGLDPWYWIYRSGYSFVEAGENLAVNFTDSRDAQRAWMNSPGHRANIMNGGFTEVGIAAVPGVYKGKNTVFVVQMFGRPAAAQVATAVVTSPASSPTPPAPAAVERVETLIKEETSARVEGIAAAPVSETPSNVQGANVTFWDNASAQPRATVSLVFIAVSLLVALVLLIMVFMQVHHHHTRSVAYALALLVLIALLSYLNTLLLSSDLAII